MAAAAARPSVAPAATRPGTRPADDALSARLWREDLPREHGFEPLEVRGRVPDELRGTLLRNGPDLFGLFGVPYGHPFEGDGAITAARFDAGGVTGAARITQSAGLVEERRAGRMRYGLGAPLWRRLRNFVGGRMKNVANTSVIAWQGRVLALMEAARPTELALSDLRTIGETDLGGVVRGAFSAHPHRVPPRRASYNFGVDYGRRTTIALYELPDAGPAREVARVPLARPVMIHDFAVTARRAVFLVHPLALDVRRLVVGASGLDELFTWRDGAATEVIVVDLDAPHAVTRFETPAFWHWHVAAARDDDDRVVVDLVRYTDASSLRAFARDSAAPLAPGALHRVTIDPAARRLATTPLSDVACEFPLVHPDREAGDWRTVWVTADGDHAIAAIDVAAGAAGAGATLERHVFGPDERCSEAVVVPKRDGADERDVWLLTLVYDGAADRSGVVVLDGARLADAPVASAWFDHRIPITFHGTWVPA